MATRARRTYEKDTPVSRHRFLRPRSSRKEQATPKFRAAIYFYDTIYTPMGLMKNPSSLLTMSDGELEAEFRKEVVPIVEDRFGKGKVESMKLVQKVDGSGWAMVGFQIDGPGFSVEPRVFIYDPKMTFADVLFKSYDAERRQFTRR